MEIPVRTRRFQRPRLVRAGAVAAISLAATAACGKAEKAAEAPSPASVEAVLVRAPANSSTLVATGPLERRREMTLSFRIPGVITALDVDDGDVVRAGQVLATLDPAGVAAAEVRATEYGAVLPQSVVVLVPGTLSGDLSVRVASFINGSVRSVTYTNLIKTV